MALLYLLRSCVAALAFMISSMSFSGQALASDRAIIIDGKNFCSILFIGSSFKNVQVIIDEDTFNVLLSKMGRLLSVHTCECLLLDGDVKPCELDKLLEKASFGERRAVLRTGELIVVRFFDKAEFQHALQLMSKGGGYQPPDGPPANPIGQNRSGDGKSASCELTPGFCVSPKPGGSHEYEVEVGLKCPGWPTIKLAFGADGANFSVGSDGLVKISEN